MYVALTQMRSYGMLKCEYREMGRFIYIACHSLYDAKSKRIAQTFSGGALIVLEADTEKTPSELRGGR